jgi:hypothetical protein
MNKLVVISTVVICFLAYGLIPLVASLLFLLATENSTLAITMTVIWGLAVQAQIISMYQIFMRNKKGLQIFFLIVFLATFLDSADLIVIFFEEPEGVFPFFSIFNEAIYPIFAFWVVYFSDAKYFFNEHIESE